MNTHPLLSMAPTLSLVLAFLAGISSQSANASGLVRYVSSTGSNQNNCQIEAPCRSIRVGLKRTPAGGELRLLDSGQFGNTATIKRAVTLSGAKPGVSVTKFTLTINAPGASVALRNISFIGGNATTTAVSLMAAAQVSFENSLVEGYTTYGVFAGGFAGRINLSHTTLRSNGDGFFVNNGAATKMSVNRSRFIGNQRRGLVLVGAQASIAESEFAGNQNAIVVSDSAVLSIEVTQVVNNYNGVRTTGNCELMIKSSNLSNNQGTGLSIGSSNNVQLADTTIVANETGIANAGTLESYRTNIINRNRRLNYINIDGTGVLIPRSGF